MTNHMLLIPAGGAAARFVPFTQNSAACAALTGAEYLELVRTPIEDLVMLVDETGALTGKPVNEAVSGKLYPGPIFGDVLLSSNTWFDGGLDTAPIRQDQLVRLAMRGVLTSFELLQVES